MSNTDIDALDQDRSLPKRSIAEILEDIEEIGEEQEQSEFGSVEWDALEVELSQLDCELRKAHKEVDRAQQSDLYHHRDLQNKGLTD